MGVVIDVLRSIAVHEAGHCVAATKLGMRVRHIAINGGIAGIDGFSFIDHDHARLNDYLVMLLSGAAAERDVMGYKTASRPHSYSDGQQISEAITQVGQPQRTLLIAAATQQAQRLVRAHRPTVLAVAGLLFEKGAGAGQPWDALEVRLYGDELDAAMGDTALLLRRAV
jgi:hypothetical protein